MAARAVSLHYIGDPAGDLSLKVNLPEAKCRSSKCGKLTAMFHKKFLAKHAAWPVAAADLRLERKGAAVPLGQIISDVFPGAGPLEFVVKSPANAPPAPAPAPPARAPPGRAPSRDR